MYMYVQSHVHVHAIEHTRTFNEIHVSGKVTKKDNTLDGCCPAGLNALFG